MCDQCGATWVQYKITQQFHHSTQQEKTPFPGSLCIILRREVTVALHPRNRVMLELVELQLGVVLERVFLRLSRSDA